MRHILVVANQTLAGEQLLSTLKDRLAEGEADVHVVVPMNPAKADEALRNPLAQSNLPDRSTDNAYKVAQQRLAHGLALIGELGVKVDGEVGDEDPMEAVDAAVTRRRYDEVIISTLPTGVSRWLRADLPSRVHRKHKLPVYTVIRQGAGVR